MDPRATQNPGAPRRPSIPHQTATTERTTKRAPQQEAPVHTYQDVWDNAGAQEWLRRHACDTPATIDAAHAAGLLTDHERDRALERLLLAEHGTTDQVVVDHVAATLTTVEALHVLDRRQSAA